MTTSLSERPVAIITGAARGIGRGCAEAFAQKGFNLVLNDLGRGEDIALLEDLSKELAEHGAECVLAPGDIADFGLHQNMIDAAVNAWGRLDCLLSNAGVTVKKRGDVLEETPDSFDHCITINTRAVFFLFQLAAKHFIKQGEIGGKHRSIVNITSSNVNVVSPLRSSYCISKIGSHMITRLFAMRLATEGVGVYEIQPGMILSEMTRPVRERYDGMINDGFVPMRRWGYPEDIGSTAVCMAEGHLRYTVGQAVAVDGGLTTLTF